MTYRRVDKQKFERADREARMVIEMEQEARKTKTARLRELQLQHGATAPEAQQPTAT